MLDRANGNRIKMPWQIYGQNPNRSVRVFLNTFFAKQTSFFPILIANRELQRLRSKSFSVHISNSQSSARREGRGKEPYWASQFDWTCSIFHLIHGDETLREGEDEAHLYRVWNKREKSVNKKKSCERRTTLDGKCYQNENQQILSLTVFCIFVLLGLFPLISVSVTVFLYSITLLLYTRFMRFVGLIASKW